MADAGRKNLSKTAGEQGLLSSAASLPVLIVAQYGGFDMEGETVADLHRLLDFGGEGEDFGRGAAVIDQHQRVFVRNADLAIARALEAALFNQPGGGDFDSAICCREGGNFRVLCL